MMRTRKAISNALACLACILSVLRPVPCTGLLSSSSSSSIFKLGYSNVRSSSTSTTKRETILFMGQNITQEDTPSPLWNSITSRVEDTSLLAADVFAIAIASQLMGLLDILNDPEFVKNGGWFQPIPAVPATLDVLIERFSILSLSWLAAALARKGSFSKDSVATDEAAIKNSLRILLDFVVLRGLIGLLFSQVAGSDPNLLSLLRDFYFVGLAVTGLRFLYGQYFRF
jgi:hypothetical protein